MTIIRLEASNVKRLRAVTMRPTSDQKCRRTGNLELLVDVATLCVVEFVDGRHPQRHLGPEDDGEHAVE